MDAGLGFRDGAVVDLGLDGLAENEESQHDFPVGRNDNPLSDGVGVGPDSDRDLR